MAEPQQSPKQQHECLEVGPGGVPKGSRTHQYYRTFDIPDRFDNPELFEPSYQHKQQNPLYRPTSTDYGANAPSVHTMPTKFLGRTQKFTNHLGPCGMYRNQSFNTSKTVKQKPSYAD